MAFKKQNLEKPQVFSLAMYIYLRSVLVNLENRHHAATIGSLDIKLSTMSLLYFLMWYTAGKRTWWTMLDPCLEAHEPESTSEIFG